MYNNLNVIVLAAGLGTRMRSRVAKVLHRAGGITLIEHVLRAAIQLAPAANIYVVVGHQSEEVQQAAANFGVRFLLQQEQRGTAHAVLTCREALGDDPGDVLVLYGDCPLLSADVLRRLVDAQRDSAAAAMVLTTGAVDPTGYGRVLLNADGSLKAIVEEKAATEEQRRIREINSGIYCFDGPKLWSHLAEILPDNPAGEYYLTDIVEVLQRHGHSVRPLHWGNASELLGINTRIELAEADGVLRARKSRELMLGGVTIENPETATVDLDAVIGADTLLQPFVQIRGASRIGENCLVGAGAIVEDSVIGDGVEIGPYTLVIKARVEAGARVGPFARLRPESTVEEGAEVGNFVELKKTRLGAGSKALHLSYLGDADIGRDVNVGAGVITCNYDGRRKHPTHIQDGAFVGSHSTLVAPVEVGQGSYVGAGSVITDEVPPDSLALARARQVIKEGWAKRRRKEP